MGASEGLIAVAMIGFVLIVVIVVTLLAPPSPKPAGGLSQNGKLIKLDGPGYALTLDGASVSLAPHEPIAGRMMMHSLPSMAEWLSHLPQASVDREIDALYDIRSEPDDFAKRIFNAETSTRLRSLGRRGSLRLLVAPALITIRVDNATPGDREMAKLGEDLIEAVIEVFHAARAAGRAEATDDSGRCLICGTALKGKVVRCAKCATPHHAECWSFNGRCATYACGSAERVA